MIEFIIDMQPYIISYAKESFFNKKKKPYLY